MAGIRLFSSGVNHESYRTDYVVILILVLLGGGYGYRRGNNVLAGGGALVGLILPSFSFCSCWALSSYDCVPARGRMGAQVVIKSRTVDRETSLFYHCVSP
jgi:hypothetical protein